MNLVNRWPYVGELGVVMEEQPTTALILRWRGPFRKGAGKGGATSFFEREKKTRHSSIPPTRGPGSGEDPVWVRGRLDNFGCSRVPLSCESEVARSPTSYGTECIRLVKKKAHFGSRCPLLTRRLGGLPFWRWIGVGYAEETNHGLPPVLSPRSSSCLLA